jgi:hypothetical protein
MPDKGRRTLPSSALLLLVIVFLALAIVISRAPIAVAQIPTPPSWIGFAVISQR